MYRELHYSRKTVKLTFLSAVIVTLMISSSVPVSGYWVEDFSNSSLDEWLFYTRPSPDRQLDHTWAVEDGSLTSTGVQDNNNDLNIACRETEDDEEEISFDVFGPEDEWRLGFRVSRYPTPSGDSYASEMPHYQIVLQMRVSPWGNYDNESQPEIHLGQYLAAYGFLGVEVINATQDMLEGWHTYRIERNELQVKVFLDDNIIFDHQLLDYAIVSDYDSICMWTEVGNQVKIDNISVGLPPNEESNGGFVLFNEPLAIVAIGLIALTSIGYSTRTYVKKKDLET